MCGIAGFTAGQIDAERARRVIVDMCDAMRHRGPDDDGYLIEPSVTLGMRRLSIIDVAGGHQPISNEDETVWVVFNGEIYNFPTLRDELLARGHRFRTNSDTETIVHLFEEMGPDAVRRLDGMFAFAVWDARRNRLVLARDRMGKKPLHYAIVGSELVFASELKALLRHPSVRRDLSVSGLSRYLMHDYVPAPGTIFREVRKLPPGHFLVREDGGTQIRQYWDLPLPANGQVASTEDAARELRSLLESATRRRLLSEVPLGAFLSGGIDSSAVVAFMARNATERVKTFHIGFDEKSFDESKHARRMAAHLATDHHEQILTPAAVFELLPRIGAMLDEPMADASVLPTYLLSRFTRQSVTVALSGDGGDELFAGYPTYQAHRLARLAGHLPKPVLALASGAAEKLPVSYGNFSVDFKIKKFLSGLGHAPEIRHTIWMGTFDPREVEQLLQPDVWSEIEPGAMFSEVDGYVRTAGDRDWLGRMLYLDAKLYLQDEVLVKVDRASMACSLEVRCPFLDTAVVEFVSRLPSAMKLRRFSTKYLLKRSLQGLVPDDILHRPKKGFGIPVGRWIRGELRELFQATLDAPRIERQGIFRSAEVSRLLAEHLDGRRDHRKKLWSLFVFQLWHQAYLDRDTLC